MPPGFIIEDDLAFDLAQTQRALLAARTIQFPMRETSLSDYAEKKRVEYHPMKDRYSGLFSDDRISFLSRNAQGLISRKTRISEQIVSTWQSGAETNKRAWDPVKKLITPQEISDLASIPLRLSDSGTALTWSAISPLVSTEGAAASRPLRNALQFTYFQQYCQEFNLIILAAVPYMVEEFYLPRRSKSYSYAIFERFLKLFNLSEFVLDSPAELLLALRNQPGFISFIDSYVQLAEKSGTATDLAHSAGRIANDVAFDFASFGRRSNVFVQMPSDIELRELCDALEEASSLMVERFDLISRNASTELMPKSKPIRVIGAMPEIVMFVALEEELNVLVKQLKLDSHFTSPFASGAINGQSVHVLCPKEMGRVPAAVEMSKYLQARQHQLPKLIIVVGLAGGFEESGTQPGHIICGTTVVDLANRKITDSEESGDGSRRSDTGEQPVTKFRRRDFDLSSSVRDVLGSNSFDTERWVKESIELADWPIDRRPSVHPGLIASVDEVIASKEWRAALLANTPKLLGVEMEAGGVCAAAREFRVPVSMLRVVSDKADPSKTDDRWRLSGMKTLAHLLSMLPYDAVKSAIK